MLGDDFIGGSAPLGIALAGRARASRAAQSLQQSGQRRTPRGVAPRRGAGEDGWLPAAGRVVQLFENGIEPAALDLRMDAHAGRSLIVRAFLLEGDVTQGLLLPAAARITRRRFA